MIEGASDIDQLDIFRQASLSQMTRKVLQLFLKPKWFRTAMVTSQAKQYFPDFHLDEEAQLQDAFIDTVGAASPSVKDYLGYVLLDFVLVDSVLEEIPFGWAFQFAEDLQLKDHFDSITKKEMKFSDKKLLQHKKQVLASYYEMKENENEQIYEG
jgi:hypothetical protein